MTPIEPDIEQRLRTDFPPEQAEEAIALLRASGKTGHLARCAIVASRGSLAVLTHWLAERDYREVIMAGEYEPGSRRRVRDLTCSFLLEGSETFWITQVARMMNSRGYTLVSLISRASATPFDRFVARRNEGIATFVGPEGELAVEKKDGRWTLRADPDELERFNMNWPNEDEQRFCDAVSGFILVQRDAR